jgi:hypothetical protein
MGVERARLRQGARLGFVEYVVIMLLLAFVIGLILGELISPRELPRLLRLRP